MAILAKRTAADIGGGEGFTITTAHCGDSRIVILDGWDGAEFGIITETVDHKPSVPSEAQRITDLGGKVCQFRGAGPMRVNGDLSVSRSLGDFRYKRYITSEPAVSAQRIISRSTKIILASDGFFEVATKQDIAFVLTHYADDPRDAVTRLYNIAGVRGSTDNITIMLVDFVDG